MQAGHIEPGRVGGDELLDDLVQTHARGVDNLGVVGAQSEEFGGHQAARVQAHRALRDHARRAERDEVGSARACSDEVDCHVVSLSVLSGFVADHWATGNCGRHAVKPPSGSPR